MTPHPQEPRGSVAPVRLAACRPKRASPAL